MDRIVIGCHSRLYSGGAIKNLFRIKLGLTAKIWTYIVYTDVYKSTDDIDPIYFWAAKIALYSGFQIIMKIWLKSVNNANLLTGLLTL